MECLVLFSFFFESSRQKLERAFTFVYFAEKSEIARGFQLVQSESCVRALRSGHVFFFVFIKRNDRRNIYYYVGTQRDNR